MENGPERLPPHRHCKLQGKFDSEQKRELQNCDSLNATMKEWAKK